MVAVDATAAERSDHTTLSREPCNLKVLAAVFERAQLKRTNETPEIFIGRTAVNLKMSLLTQFKLGIKAEAVVTF